MRDDWHYSLSVKSNYKTPTGEDLEASANIALAVYYRLTPSFFLLDWIYSIKGDLEKSVAYAKEAHTLDPTRIEIVKEYGISLITLGLDLNDDKLITKGKALLESVEYLPNRLKTDQIDKTHVKMLLADINLCPSYSRDQQQETSETAYTDSQNKY